METYTPKYLPYLSWDGTEPLSVILVAGDAGATCPPRARQWMACRQLVDAMGGTVVARYTAISWLMVAGLLFMPSMARQDSAIAAGSS